MAYFDNYDKEYWHELGTTFKIFKTNEVNSFDIERSNIVADEIIKNYTKRSYDKTQDLTFSHVLQNAATTYYNLGMYSTAEKAVSILHKLQYKENNSEHEEVFTVHSMIVRSGGMVSKTPYYLDVPKKFTTTSIPFVVHEIAHMLKEKNPYECMGLHTDLEVIPILMEMISAHKQGNNNAFKKREILMLDIAFKFKKLQRDITNNNINPKDKLGFETFYKQNILYLNSFYYSIRLFSLYLDAPNYVIGILEDVFNQKITTRDVIQNYLLDGDYTYDSGINEFRNKLK